MHYFLIEIFLTLDELKSFVIVNEYAPCPYYLYDSLKDRVPEIGPARWLSCLPPRLATWV